MEKHVKPGVPRLDKIYVKNRYVSKSMVFEPGFEPLWSELSVTIDRLVRDEVSVLHFGIGYDVSMFL